MKVLFITTQFPYPLDNGGKIGAFNGLSVVSAENDVVCFSFSEQPEFIDEGLTFFKKKLPNVTFLNPVFHDIHIRKKRLKLLKTMIKDYICNLPYLAAKFENKKMYRAIDDYFSANNCDIVFIDYLNMNMYGKYIRKKYKNHFKIMVLKDHNKEYEIIKQAAEHENNFIKRVILESEWRKTLRYETRAISNVDIVFSVCDENSEFFRKYNVNTYTMFPTYEMLVPYKNKDYTNRILYMGNLSWGANMEGIKWFVDNVFPIIKKKLPEVTLTIVGSGPAENPFSENAGVIYKGYIKDISNIYNNYNVFIVPLFEGSGIRIKILEAFNNEIAVVSTSLGCETIGVSNKKELLIADETISFATAVIELLQNKELNKQLIRNAKELLKNKYSLTVRVKEFGDIMEKFTNE